MFDEYDFIRDVVFPAVAKYLGRRLLKYVASRIYEMITVRTDQTERSVIFYHERQPRAGSSPMIA